MQYKKICFLLEEAWEVAKENNVPFLVDTAAEKDLEKYPQISDLVVYSGSKAIEGPTSGIVAGKSAYIDWVKNQLHIIGRSMKVGRKLYLDYYRQWMIII